MRARYDLCFNFTNRRKYTGTQDSVSGICFVGKYNYIVLQLQNSLNNIYNFAICFQVSENSQTNFFTEQKHSSKFHGAGRSEQNCNLCTYLHYMHAKTQNLISFFSNKKVILIDF